MGSLAGKVALVTGASNGIGRAIAVRLAGAGALVGIHYGSSEARAKETLTAVEAEGGRGFLVHAELGVEGDADQLWENFDQALAATGTEPGVDILVNNAGFTAQSGVEMVDSATFDKLFAINVKAPVFIVQKGLSRLRDGGRIINTASCTTRIASPSVLGVGITKGAVNTMTLTLAQDLGPRGITVNAVAPGFTETGATSKLFTVQKVRDWAADFSVFKRIGQPDDIAAVAAFLASDDARWVSGQIIDASGGSWLGVPGFSLVGEEH